MLRSNEANADARPKLRAVGFSRFVGRADAGLRCPARPVQREPEHHGAGDGDNRADGGYADSDPCRYFLPFSGCGTTIGGFGSFALGGQIVGLMGVGFLFALAGVLCLFWAFYNPYRKRRNGARLAAIFGPVLCAGTGYWYAWAGFAHPWKFWLGNG